MKILLSKLPKLRGIYDDKVPTWARYLHPDAAKSVVKIEEEMGEMGGLIYTSVWRSANGSLWAIKNKSGALPPGFSAHNYGLAVDLTIDRIEKEFGWSYDDILRFMQKHGWYCHRQDGKKKFENWHFNFLGEKAVAQKYLKLATSKSRTWHLPIEKRVCELYQDQWESMDLRDVQAALKKLKFYLERVDGLWGPYSREALQSFQRAYKMRQASRPTMRDLRTLAFCTATKELVKP
jgi:hypothetical protein